jgi:hypothetical protein
VRDEMPGRSPFLPDGHPNITVPGIDTTVRRSSPRAPSDSSTPWDYSHINAVNPDTDGKILVSGRRVSTISKVSHQTGKTVALDADGNSIGSSDLVSVGQ